MTDVPPAARPRLRPSVSWLACVAACCAACSLDEVPLIPLAPIDDGPRPDASVDAGDAGGLDAGADAGRGCSFAVSAPSEVTLGTRVHVTSGLSCVEPPGEHTCAWRARWSDDADEVDPVESGEHPCAAGEVFDFTAAASSDDRSSVYWVSLEIDGVVTPTRGQAHVYVGQLRRVEGSGKALGKVADIAIDAESRRAWLASEAGLVAMLDFADEHVALTLPPTDRCGDAVVACVIHTVAVAGGLAFGGVDADQDAVARATIADDVMTAADVALPRTTKIRSIVAGGAGGDEAPGLYVSSPDRTWTVTRGELALDGLDIATQLATGGADLAAIVATAVQFDFGSGSEALWRLETGGSGELQRIATVGAGLASVDPEDVLNKSGSSAAVFAGMLVVGQRDGNARAVDLAALDPVAETPLADVTDVFELPVANDPDGALDTLTNLLDLFVSEDGATLWAVSATTLYRVTAGVLFESRSADVPAGMLSVASLRDAGGAEVVLVGTADGVWITRPDLHPSD